MASLTLTVFQLEGTAPEKTLGLLKKGVSNYVAVDLLDVVYLVSETSPNELFILASWGNDAAVERAGNLWKERSAALKSIGINPDLQQTLVFKVVKEFQRYHLSAQTASISVGRVADPQLSLEQALDWVKLSSKEYLINWPGLVRHRMAHTFDGSNLILLHNDWVSEKSRQEYLVKYSESYQAAASKAGVKYLFSAGKRLDTFKAKLAISQPTALKSKPDASL